MNTDVTQLLAEDPGNPAFADHADFLCRQGNARDALEVCFKGLSRNPDLHKGRLALARAFYLLGHTPFAVRELVHLCRSVPDNQSLRKLLDKLSPTSLLELAHESTSSTVAETVAEADFDIDTLDSIDDAAKS